MSIILMILKIIGIAFLAILVLLLILVLAVLLIPARYRISGKADERISVRLQISWLRPCISWKARFEEQHFEQTLRIFGIPLKKRSGEDKKPKKKGRPKKKRKPQKKPEPKVLESKTAVQVQAPELQRSEPAEAAEPAFTKKRSRLDAVRSFFYKVKQLPGMIKLKVETLKEKALNFKELLARMKTEFEDEMNRNVLKLLFTELKDILKHFAPRRVKAEVSFSAGEPSATGQALGIISMLPFVYRYEIRLYPDFERDELYFKGTYDIKGHIRGVHALLLMIRFIKDKNISGLIQRYRNL